MNSAEQAWCACVWQRAPEPSCEGILAELSALGAVSHAFECRQVLDPGPLSRLMSRSLCLYHARTALRQRPVLASWRPSALRPMPKRPRRLPKDLERQEKTRPMAQEPEQERGLECVNELHRWSLQMRKVTLERPRRFIGKPEKFASRGHWRQRPMEHARRQRKCRRAAAWCWRKPLLTWRRDTESSSALLPAETKGVMKP